MINNRLLGLRGISAKAGKVVSGSDACYEQIQQKKVKLIIIAQDASEKTKKNYMFYGNKYNVPVVIESTIDELSKAIGKKNKAIIGIKDFNLSTEIQKIINGGEIIGQNKNS